jgi:hypothetical protein
MADLNRHSSECVLRCPSQPLPGIGHCPNCNRIANNVIDLESKATIRRGGKQPASTMSWKNSVVALSHWTRLLRNASTVAMGHF